MSHTTDTDNAQLSPERLEEVRVLVARLRKPAPDDTPQLLADARTALTELLADRDALLVGLSKLAAIERPLHRAWRKDYRPDLDEVADVLGWPEA